MTQEELLRLPKVELHCHLDGSLSQEFIEKRLGRSVKKEELSVSDDCTSLAEYLEKFDMPCQCLKDEEGLEEAGYDVLKSMSREHVCYAEIRFAPQLSVNGGLTQDEVVEAAIRGAERGMKAYPEIRVGLILCCMRGADNEALNMQTVETAKKYLGPVVCAVDIAGAEGLFPTENFAPVFAKVREYGIPMTIHAGEAAGPESIRQALSFGTKRIGHGVAAINDPELIRRLIDENVTLEVCVTSNYHTKVVPAIEMHPIHKLLDEGVHVTVNSDNRTCSRTTLQKEKEVLKEELGFTDEEIEKMQEYAWEARFLK